MQSNKPIFLNEFSGGVQSHLQKEGNKLPALGNPLRITRVKPGRHAKKNGKNKKGPLAPGRPRDP
jgi:hypothetical protein